jgi:hypothetical protein
VGAVRIGQRLTDRRDPVWPEQVVIAEIGDGRQLGHVGRDEERAVDQSPQGRLRHPLGETAAGRQDAVAQVMRLLPRGGIERLAAVVDEDHLIGAHDAAEREIEHLGPVVGKQEDADPLPRSC